MEEICSRAIKIIMKWKWKCRCTKAPEAVLERGLGE